MKVQHDANSDEVVEMWYEIQYSIRNADDWFDSLETSDTLPAAKKKMDAMGSRDEYKYRIVLKTLTESVVNVSR